MNLELKIVLVMLCISVSHSSANISVSDSSTTVKPPPVVSATTLIPTKAQTLLPAVVATHTAQTSEHVVSVNTSTNSSDNEKATAENKTKVPLIINNKNGTISPKNMSIENPAPIAEPKQENTTSVNVTIQPTTQAKTTENATVSPTQSTSTTAVPVVYAADHIIPTPTSQDRQFDGPSFVGGIVLTVGLTIIGFIVFKFYKSGKIERRYRTL